MTYIWVIYLGKTEKVKPYKVFGLRSLYLRSTKFVQPGWNDRFSKPRTLYYIRTYFPVLKKYCIPIKNEINTPSAFSASYQLWYDLSLIDMMSRDRFHSPYAQSIINTTPSFFQLDIFDQIRWPSHFTSGLSSDMAYITWLLPFDCCHVISTCHVTYFRQMGNRINISCGRKMIKLNYSE